MRSIARVFWGSLVLLFGVWWVTDPGALSGQQTFFQWRDVLMQNSGVIGIGVMSLAMILAVRPVVLEPWLGGLDKMFRLHKWLGIAGLVISISHWAIAKAPHWLIDLGLLTRPARGPRVLPDDPVERLFLQQRHLAESVGEWAFYAAVVLIALALFKRFPYNRFVPVHKLLAAAYLVLVFHSVFLLKFSYWTGPAGIAVALLMALGSAAAVMSLLKRRAGRNPVAGHIVGLEHQPVVGVVAIDVELDGTWPGHEAGQFAFLTLPGRDGAHPFTIASAWQGDRRLRFIVKGLGDFTRRLPSLLKPGDAVKVEGPYGRFNFDGPARRQIWIGGGIGITPFIARMQALARHRDGRAIDLFHTTAAYDPQAIGRLTHDAAEAGVRLHVLWDERDGRLDLQRIADNVPDWRQADVWFCGPAGFGKAIKQGLAAMGLPEQHFHQELFQMR